MNQNILLQQLDKTPQENDIKSNFFFLVPKEEYVSWLWDMKIAAFLIDENCNLEQFNEILENLETSKRAKAILFTFCSCLTTKEENESLDFILQNQMLKVAKDSWKIFWKQDFINSENGSYNFKTQIGKYVESHRKSSSDNVTSFLNAPIQMKCGDWICDEQGVYQWKKDKKTEEIHQVFASKQQILLSGIIENMETGKQKYQLSFSSKRNGKFHWKTILAEPSICSSKNKIIGLSDFGIRATDSTARLLVDYLDDIYTLNEDVIPVQRSIARLGWIEKNFFPYINDVIFDGDSKQKDIVAAIHEQGNFKSWKQSFQKFRENLMFRLITDTCLASVLIEKIGGLCFILHLWGNTGKGKTVGLMAAASIWGEPEKLLLSTNVTINYCTTRATLFRNLPVLIDETQISGNKLDNLIYSLTEGKERGRLTRNGEERSNNSWFCTSIFTGERPIVNEKSGSGAINRVIELPIDDPLFDDFGQAIDMIQENYGFAGKRFVEYIQGQDVSKLKEEYNKIQKEIRLQSDSTGKQASSLAFIILADKIANKCIFDDEKPLSLDKLTSILKTETEVSQSERAYKFVISWIAANPIYFQSTGTKILGRIDKDFCFFNQSELMKLLSENNFDFEAIKKDWATTGYLEKNSQGRYFHYTTIFNTLKTQYIKIKISKEESEFQKIRQEKIPFN